METCQLSEQWFTEHVAFFARRQLLDVLGGTDFQTLLLAQSVPQTIGIFRVLVLVQLLCCASFVSGSSCLLLVVFQSDHTRASLYKYTLFISLRWPATIRALFLEKELVLILVVLISIHDEGWPC